jgi:hypothetical protein
VADLVVRNAEPRDRSEQEIAGYRDALRLVHESHADMRFTESVVLQLHQMLYRYQPGSGRRWKGTDNQIVERDGTGTVVRVRQQPEMLGEVPPEPDDAGICEALPHPQIGGKAHMTHHLGTGKPFKR